MLGEQKTREAESLFKLLFLLDKPRVMLLIYFLKLIIENMNEDLQQQVSALLTPALSIIRVRKNVQFV